MVVEVWFLLTLITNAHSFENLAYRRPVYELHPWPTTDKDYGSQNAVDGLYTDRSAAGGQCSITADNNYTEALLRIDLGAVVSISYITIYFRTENQQRPTVYSSKMAGFFLYVSNTTSINDGYLCYHEIQNEVGTPSENQNISCSVHGRYITFYNERRPEVVYPDYYSEFAHNEVCELEVYGCREPGNFGEKCSLTCPERCQEKRCNISTGFCLGCLPGYKGPSCKDVCDELTFGLECASNCRRCRNGTPCHHENGTCLQGCDEGVFGDMCQSVCRDGYYGIKCLLLCSENCYVTRRCDRITGKCVEGCKPGWRTDSCELKCSSGYYGKNCENRCSENCYITGRCDSVTGQCNRGCKPGWTTKTCKQTCPIGTFGPNCRQECGHCFREDQCHFINGSCLKGCSSGYEGERCKYPCSTGYFGINCSHTCNAYCRGNSSCNHRTGVCDSGCKELRIGDLCGPDSSNGITPILTGFVPLFFKLQFLVLLIVHFSYYVLDKFE